MTNDLLIDDLILEVANSDKEGDRGSLYKLLLDAELFSPIQNSDTDVKVSLKVVKLDEKKWSSFLLIEKVFLAKVKWLE